METEPAMTVLWDSGTRTRSDARAASGNLLGPGADRVLTVPGQAHREGKPMGGFRITTCFCDPIRSGVG